MVVLAGQGAAVGPRARHGDEVAGLHVGRQVLVEHDDVTALAVPSDDPRQHRPGLGPAIGQGARVVGLVQRRARVVAHAAVDRDVGAGVAAAELDGLDRAHLVQGERAGPDDGATGLDRDPGQRAEVAVTDGLELAFEDAGHLACQRARRERGVLRGVGDAVPAAEVDLGTVVTVFVGDAGMQRDEPVSGHLEAAGVEDLAADVAVQAEQVEDVRAGEDARGRLERLTTGEAEAELLVLVTGGDELVGVRLDTHGHAHHDGGDDPELGGDHRDALDLLEGVDDDSAHPVGQCRPDLRDALVVAVEADPLTGELHPLISPAKVISVMADPDEKTASVIVPDYQLSLAIGKEGQNARLAARLTGYKIDIKNETQAIESGELPENYMELSEGVYEEEYDDDAEEFDVENTADAEYDDDDAEITFDEVEDTEE